MKTIIVSAFWTFLLMGSANASTIKRADLPMSADASAYVTKNRLEADCIVYLVGDEFQARETGVWYFTNSSFEADAEIYFTENRSASDIVVYFTDNRMEAKCMY